jgi:hypothetical protein
MMLWRVPRRSGSWRNGNRDRGPFGFELHDAVAAALANGDKSMLFENPANL